MGDHWWVFMLGVGMLSVMLYCAFTYKPDPEACPRCHHEDGLNAQGTRCAGVDDNNGWSTHTCTCQNDYHWNYDSVVDPLNR